MKGSRILITGGVGFVGSNLAEACLAAGAEVTLYDSLDPRAGGNVANIEDLRSRVKVVEADILDADALARELPGHDAVFHCAALTSHGGSLKDPFAYEEVNCKGTLRVLEAVRTTAPSTRLVFVGTSTQVGRMIRNPVDETHSEYPLDLYSATKTAAEKYVLLYATAHGLRASSVRFANLYGPRAHIRTPAFGFINFFIGLALQGKPITVFGDGAQLRTVTYIGDAVQALIAVAKSDATVGQALFATSDDQLSVAAIARGIARVIGGEVRHVDWPAANKAMEVGDAIVSSERLRAATGWRDAVAFAEGLGTTRDYFGDRLARYLVA